MIRKYNYTGRQKIAIQKVEIKQLDAANGIKSFQAILNLSDLGFPDHAKIYIEPYFKTSFMRFDFGTVARISHPKNTDLIEIPATDKILYRVKIVDESNTQGLILGYIDRLIAITGNNSGNKKSLLPVDYNELGNIVWRLDFRDDGPYLTVNKNIEGIQEIVKNDSKFFSLVYPEVVRQIALKIVSDQGIDYDDDSTWEGQWGKFFKTTLGVICWVKEEKDWQQWSDEVMEAFCRKYQVMKSIIN